MNNISEQMQSEIIDINNRIDELDDPRQRYLLLKEKINNFKNRGIKIPESLERLERILLQECLNESQGR
ncbi:MAG: hypothetical protein ACKOW3_01375 [Hyphomicrobium sp.]